jgi:GWxTD domain-containing protein
MNGSTGSIGRFLIPALLLLIGCYARLAAHPAEVPMNLVYSYHAFELDSVETMVELDYQFNGQALAAHRHGDLYVGQLYLKLDLFDSTGRHVLGADWITSHSKSGTPSGEYTLVGKRLLAVRPGSYKAHIYYEDANDRSRHDSTIFTMTVPDLTTKRLATSDIMIAADISPSTDTADQFYRNGYHLVPNISSVIAPPFLVLNSYVEIYHADRVPTAEYDMIYALADSAGHIFFRKDVKRQRPSAAGVVETNTLTLEEVPSGDYYLILEVFDGLARSARDSSIVLRRFTLLNPEKDSAIAAAQQSKVTPAQEIEPLYAGMKESELDDEFAKAKFIATSPEVEMWEQLSGAASKGRFLTSFWEKRDPSPETAVNEFRKEYDKRIDKARTMYSTGLSPHGWDSDRGRVLMKYGSPDGIDRHPSDYNRKPYEIWQYNSPSYEFVFVDRSQTGNYVLVHSTAPGEISYENWEEDYAQINKFRNSQGWGD